MSAPRWDVRHLPYLVLLAELQANTVATVEAAGLVEAHLFTHSDSSRQQPA